MPTAGADRWIVGRLGQRMLDATDDQVWAVEPERFLLLAWNAATAASVRASFGRELREGMPLDEILPNEAIVAIWRERFQQTLATGHLALEATLFAGESVGLTIDVAREAETPVALVCVARPLATQRRMQSELARREAFYRKVLGDSADVTSVLARDGRRIFISSGVTAVLGFTQEEALTIQVAASTHPEDQAYVGGVFRRLLEEPRSTARLRFRQRHKNGGYHVVDALARNALDDPDVQGVVVTTRDVTEQVKLETQFLQAQKLECVGRLAGGVAHDFNNLLMVILSSGELLERAAKRGQPLPTEYASEIMAAAERARDLTRQLLAFARKEAVKPVPVDLNVSIGATQKMLPRLLGEDIEVRVELAPALWAIRCDPGQIDQILFNLAVNARDAMPGGGRFSLRTRNLPGAAGAHDRVELEVVDTGVGMTPEVIAHAFEPFFTTKETGKGTGLGLATIHGIVEQHGGTIELESEPGRGTRFVLRFPRCEAVEAPEVSAGPHEPKIGHETVLLVEDDPMVRLIEERTLRDAGYHVLTAIHGQQALERLRVLEGPLHLLVTDVVMPRLDGVTLHQEALALRPGLPVIFTSGYTDDRVSADKLAGPGVDFLAKPFTPRMLLERVRASLDAARR
jgi:PAS domain S-box-containing protein